MVKIDGKEYITTREIQALLLDKVGLQVSNTKIHQYIHKGFLPKPSEYKLLNFVLFEKNKVLEYIDTKIIHKKQA